jgi:hypothetical protein
MVPWGVLPTRGAPGGTYLPLQNCGTWCRESAELQWDTAVREFTEHDRARMGTYPCRITEHDSARRGTYPLRITEREAPGGTYLPPRNRGTVAP